MLTFEEFWLRRRKQQIHQPLPIQKSEAKMLAIFNVVRISIGIMFGVATVGKLASPKHFIEGVQAYRIVPQVLARLLAPLIIVCEAFLCLAHLAGLAVFLTSICGIVLLGVFAISVVINLRQEREIPCHSFGNGTEETISKRSVVRLALAMLGEIFLFYSVSWAEPPLNPSSFSNWSPDGVAVFSWSILLLVGVEWLLRAAELFHLVGSRQPGPLSESPGAV